MAISFTSDQLKKLSKDYLGYPEAIQTQEQSLAFLQQDQQDMLKKDEENAIFFKNYLNICNQYHKEFANLIGVQRTNYTESFIDQSARLSPNSPHFPGTTPSNMWKPLTPKVHPSNNGQPTSTTSTWERERAASCLPKIDLMVSGFSSGGTTTSSVSGMLGNVLTVSGSGIVIGNFIIVNQASVSFYGQVTGTLPSGPNTQLTINFIHPTVPGSIGVGATVRNFFGGFSDAERQSVSSGTYQNVITDLANDINGRVIPWRTHVSNQLDALNANDASGEEKKEITDGKSNVQRALATLNAFFAAPFSGVGGRFGDAFLLPVRSEAVTRDRDIGVRFGQIQRRLGSVVQNNSDGSFTGSGNYFSMFKWINLRIHKLVGSLSSYYRSQGSDSAIQERIKVIKDKQSEIGSFFVITKASASADGTNKIVLEDVKGFVVGDQVKVIADDLDVLNATIQTITDKTLIFDRIIPNTYTMDKVLRILKNK